MTDYLALAEKFMDSGDEAAGHAALIGIGYELRRLADATDAQLTGVQRQILKQNRESPTPARPDPGDTW